MASKKWTRDELLLALNLYYRIPFGRQHSRAPEIVDLARRLDRTPSSVAMKLNNLTSLDPDEIARGVKGLDGASKQDEATWNEFHVDWESMTALSEQLWEQLYAGNSHQSEALQPVEPAFPHTRRPRPITSPTAPFSGQLEVNKTVRVRLAQNFFRRTVLAAYRVRCCITGLDVPELLRASHIVAWSKDTNERLNPRNGLCLSALHDAAFDRHLITFTPTDMQLVVTSRLKQSTSHDILHRDFLYYEGKPIAVPERFAPDLKFINQHYHNAML